MIQEIMRDTAFLAQKAEPATPADLQLAADLLETLTSHKDGCVGMAANMIGVNKRIMGCARLRLASSDSLSAVLTHGCSHVCRLLAPYS